MKNRTSDRMLIILIASSLCGIHQSWAQSTSALQYEEGDTVKLSCSLTGTYTHPTWVGPPSLTAYTNQGSGTINPAVAAASRLQYASNLQDLLLSSAIKSDSGVYKCSYTALGDHTITLTITEKTTTTTDGRYNCTGMEDSEVIDTEEECICIWTFIGILLSLAVYIMSSMVVGCCLYFCEESCCCDVDDQLPSWMQKWWQKVIFVGILIVYLIWKRCTECECFVFGICHGDVEPREENPQPRELPLPPLRTMHGRDLSAINNVKHLLEDADKHPKKAGALDALSEGTGGEGQVKKKKKKKKKKLQDDEV